VKARIRIPAFTRASAKYFEFAHGLFFNCNISPTWRTISAAANMNGSSNGKIGIIGSGKMGTDIFYYLADFNFWLTWVCIGEEEKNKVLAAYERKLERQRRYGLIDEGSVHEKKSRVNITDRLSELSDCNIIIEAINEDAGAKTALFCALDPLIRRDAVVVSNSSSIKPSRLITGAMRVERYAGLHFFYPVKNKNIAEVMTTNCTGEDALNSIRKFLSTIDKFYLEMHEDDGFILNRIFLDLQSQAYRYFADGILAPGEIDAIVKKYLFPSGVFEFFDGVGIDVIYQSVCNFTEDSPCAEFYRPLREGMKKMLQENRLGQKNGAGFYNYPRVHADENFSCGEEVSREISSCLLGLYVNSAFKAIEKNAFPQNSLEYAIKEYMGIENGPFELARDLGPDKIMTVLLRHYENTGFEVFKPSQILTSA
jgi:3-hydroxybutyryl-CoA dehydrogenase